MYDEGWELLLSSREAAVSRSFWLGVLTLGIFSMPSGGGMIQYSCRLPKTFNRGVVEIRYTVSSHPPSTHNYGGHILSG